MVSSHPASVLACAAVTPAEILAVYEDEVVRLQLLMRQQGTARGVPGIMYELADLQVWAGQHVHGLWQGSCEPYLSSTHAVTTDDMLMLLMCSLCCWALTVK